MMPPDAPTAEPIPSLPPRLAWFAVWRWKRRRSLVTLLVIAALVGYPLSIGPAEWLRSKGRLPDSALHALIAFYAPLAWVCEQSDFVRNALMDYAELWWSLP